MTNGTTSEQTVGDPQWIRRHDARIGHGVKHEQFDEVHEISNRLDRIIVTGKVVK